MKFYSLFSLLLLLPGSLAMAQQAAPQNQPISEMETKEAPAKFTSRVNLVPVTVVGWARTGPAVVNLGPVTVVVRDRNGHAVGNLTKEDFRLLDNGKTQVISRFSIEKPGAPVVLEKEAGDLELQPDSKTPEAGAAAPAPPVLADHFVAYLFDDVHVQAEDIMRARDAAARVIATSMQPADRAAIY